MMKRNTFLKSLLGLPFLFSFTEKTVKKNPVVTFTPEMLKKYNFGMYLINDKADVVKNPDYSATVCWKLGWHLFVARPEIPKYGKMNFLTDGWFHAIGHNYEDICEYLNNNPHGEKFRIMTKEELFYIIEHRTNEKQLFYEQ